jgi:hypothetical protein
MSTQHKISIIEDLVEYLNILFAVCARINEFANLLHGSSKQSWVWMIDLSERGETSGSNSVVR